MKIVDDTQENWAIGLTCSFFTKKKDINAHLAMINLINNLFSTKHLFLVLITQGYYWILTKIEFD